MILRDDQVLLTHYAFTDAAGAAQGGWTLPGGGMERGESPAECCVREVLEETGYHVELTGLLDVDAHWIAPEARNFPDGDKPLMGLKMLYTARITGGDLVCEVDGSTVVFDRAGRPLGVIEQ